VNSTAGPCAFVGLAEFEVYGVRMSGPYTAEAVPDAAVADEWSAAGGLEGAGRLPEAPAGAAEAPYGLKPSAELPEAVEGLPVPDGDQ
jgi:hypothetical protein